MSLLGVRFYGTGSEALQARARAAATWETGVATWTLLRDEAAADDGQVFSFDK